MDFMGRIRSRAVARRRGEYKALEHVRPGVCHLQHDFDIADGAGAAVRGDINNAIEALATCSSGASAPATTYAYMVWADTTNNLLKQRNAANTAWVVRGTLAESFVTARSANTILGVSDFGKVFNCTSTFTQTLTAAATLGDGWYCSIRNSGSGIITIDPNGAETIDGSTTITVQPGEAFVIWCTGSAFITVGRANINGLTEDTSPALGSDYVMAYDASAGGLKKVLLGRVGGGVLATEVAATSGTSIDFTSIPSWVKKITVMFNGVSTNGTDGWLIQIGDSGGVESTSYNAVGWDQAGTISASTAGFPINSAQAANVIYGAVTLTLQDASDNTWVANGALALPTITASLSVAGAKALSAPLDRVRITTTGGTNTFDAGAISILYE